MTIVRNLRQTIIDHDPKTGAVVGATQVFQRHVEEDGKHMGLLEAEHEDLPVKEIPTLWGETTDAYAAKLKETSEILQSERDAHAEVDKAQNARIGELESLLEAASRDGDRLKSIIHGVQKIANSL